MASMTMRIMAAVVAAVAVADSITCHALAEDCTTKLTRCLPYLNATTGKTPSDTCCTPLKSAVADQRACLCSLFNTPGLLESFDVNSTQVVILAESCGVNATPTTLCSNTAARDSSPSGVGTSPAVPPPPLGSGTTPGKIIDVGVSSIVLVLVSLMLH